MHRRTFLKRGFYASAALAAPAFDRVLGSGIETARLPFDLVAVRGGEPAAMVDLALNAFGGIKAFVQPNQTVVIKPNIGWDAGPERAANTNPAVVKRLAEHCLQAGAKWVRVFDHTCDNWRRAYGNSGIEAAVRDAGGEMVPGNDARHYHEVKVKNGRKLKAVQQHELIHEADVFFNVPVLKSHGGSRLTIGMKNLMGTVQDRGYWHRNDLHQCIADFAPVRKPDLTIVDAWRVMKTHGPRGSDAAQIDLVKSLVASPDIVAADTVATKLFGLDPAEVRYLALAEAAGAGATNLEQLRISRITV